MPGRLQNFYAIQLANFNGFHEHWCVVPDQKSLKSRLLLETRVQNI